MAALPLQAGEPEPDRSVKELFRVETKRFVAFYAIVPDGTTLAYCEALFTEEEKPLYELVKVELATGKELGRRRIYRIAGGGVFSADGKRLAVGSLMHEGAVGSIWDVAHWEPKVRLKCPDGHMMGRPLAFSPDGKFVVGHAHPRKRLTTGMSCYHLVLWDSATGDCRVLDDPGANFVGGDRSGLLSALCLVDAGGKERETPAKGPLLGFRPVAANFSDHGESGHLFVEYHAMACVFTTLWDVDQGKPLRTVWGGGWGATANRMQYALAGTGAPAPGTAADLYRFRTTPGGRALLLPKYNPPPVIALPYDDGTIAVAVAPAESHYGAAVPFPNTPFTELWRTEDYKNTTHRTCRLTADGRRLVAVGFDPRTAGTNQANTVLRVWDVSALHAAATKEMSKLAGDERERLWDGLFKD
jgi:WD40 repeat protein